jgi:glycine/D-amino acid oxidase-like deaminating enzyme
MTAYDAIVAGGGLVGSAVGYGLARQGLSVAVLDEGDLAYRASRGNFGLVWVQGKGDGLPAYADWTRSSADRWPAFAETLSGEIGQDIGYRKPGGIHLCLSEAEMEQAQAVLARLHNQAGPAGYDYRVLDRQEVLERLPGIGPAVVGGTYGPHDGHVSPLLLLKSLHAGLARHKGAYRPGAKAERITASGGSFRVEAGGETHVGAKLVIAAGLGSRALGRQVGLDVPVDPLKGQILVTERTKPLLDLPTIFVRQTEEGSILLGDSHENVGFDIGSTVDVISNIAARAVRSFPFLRDLRIVRSWAALRIMTPDGFPVYDESESCPGAYAVTCHSGVTLAAAHALRLAPAIVEGGFRELLTPFSVKRFHVQAT